MNRCFLRAIGRIYTLMAVSGLKSLKSFSMVQPPLSHLLVPELFYLENFQHDRLQSFHSSTFIHTHTYVAPPHIHTCTHTHTHTHMYTHIHTCTHTQTYTYVHIHTSHMYAHTHRHTHTYVHTHTCTHTHTYTYTQNFETLERQFRDRHSSNTSSTTAHSRNAFLVE